MDFTLARELFQDTVEIGHFELSLALLMDDAAYPWVILVPRRALVREIYELDDADQRLLLMESSFTAQKLSDEFHADKINIGALGNMVPQLHLHHIVRFKSDKAWPHPVWGRFPREPYGKEARELRLDLLRRLLFVNPR